MSIPLIWPISEPTLPAFTTKLRFTTSTALRKTRWNKTVFCFQQNPIHWAQIANIQKQCLLIQPSAFLTWISCYSPLSSEPYSKHSSPFCQTSPHKKANILTNNERRFPKHQPVSSAKTKPNEEASGERF